MFAFGCDSLNHLIDQRMLTGESQPAEKEIGERVFAGTMVLSGRLLVEVEKAGADTVAAQIGNILTNTADFKTFVQSRWIEQADKLALPILVLSAMAWPVAGTVGVATICNSALAYNMRVLAPIGMLNYLSLASQRGILIKDGRSLDLLTQVDTVVFDKTGTLTQEIPQVSQIYPEAGYGEREFAAFGIRSRHRPSRFEQCLDIMRRLWAGETVSYQGRWTIDNAFINPTPPQPIEVWIAARAQVALERAARMGDGWLAAPGLRPVEAKADLDHYVASCHTFGRPVGIRAIRRDIYIGGTMQEAEAVGGRVVAEGYRGFAPDATIVGDAAAVAEKMAELAEMGFTDVIVRNLVSDQDQALACIGRLEEVKGLLE